MVVMLHTPMHTKFVGIFLAGNDTEAYYSREHFPRTYTVRPKG